MASIVAHGIATRVASRIHWSATEASLSCSSNANVAGKGVGKVPPAS